RRRSPARRRAGARRRAPVPPPAPREASSRRRGAPPPPAPGRGFVSGPGSKALPPADVDRVNPVLVAQRPQQDVVRQPPLELDDRFLVAVERLRVRDKQVRGDLFPDRGTDVGQLTAGEDRIDLKPIESEETLCRTGDSAGERARAYPPRRRYEALCGIGSGALVRLGSREQEADDGFVGERRVRRES